ncbi:MAG: DsbA family protein [Ghiorsea sp.]
MKEIDFYFDFISPYTYFAVTQLDKFEAEHNVKTNWVPIDLPKLIKISGNVGPATIKNKALYTLHDLKRWASYLNVPFKVIRPGSFDSHEALSIAASLDEDDRALFCKSVFSAIWSASVNMKQEDWLDQVFEQQKIPNTWRELSSDDIEANTKHACEIGAFGAPTFVVHGQGRPQMFFGMDRMDFLSRACQS